MKKIIPLFIVFVSISMTLLAKGPATSAGPRPANPATQDSLFEFVATGDFKLEDVVGKGYPVIINFSAKWCGPCQKMKPHYNQANEDYRGKAILKTIDVDDPSMQEIVRAAGVSAVPQQILFYADGSIPSPERSAVLFEKYGVEIKKCRRSGRLIAVKTGAINREMIDEIIKELSTPVVGEK